jgi:hypothetical protein
VCDSTALAFIKTLDPNAGYSQTNFVTDDTTNLPETWDRYSISLGPIDAGLVGQILQVGFASTANSFEPSGVFYDNIVVDLDTADVLYEQSFETLVPAPQEQPTSLAEDGWLVFGNVFDGTVDPPTLKFPYGPFAAPNGGAAFSAVVAGEGGSTQGEQQLSIYNDYNCCDLETANPQGHGNDTDLVESNVFQELFTLASPIPADAVGKTLTFSFDAKRGNINDPADPECAAP